MNLAEFLAQPEDLRRRYYAAAEEACGLPGNSIEKDLWVCATLQMLTELPSCKGALTFKGGTSLSKGWKLIERFSEDIDLVLDRERLGVGVVDLKQWEALGSNARQRELERLGNRCREYVQNGVRGDLEREIPQRFPIVSESTYVVVDEGDQDGQTLLLKYPTAFGHDDYVQPRVKIELGARSDVEPYESPEILPYLVEALPDKIDFSPVPVRTVAPERTFWEKAMLLHEETFRASGGHKGRMSRHYYDLFRLIEAGIAAKAMANPQLFDSVARHRKVFFRKSREAQDSLRPGSLRLLPQGEDRKAWEKDYRTMQESMFFGESPDFENILTVVGGFELVFNSRKEAP